MRQLLALSPVEAGGGDPLQAVQATQENLSAHTHTAKASQQPCAMSRMGLISILGDDESREQGRRNASCVHKTDCRPVHSIRRGTQSRAHPLAYMTVQVPASTQRRGKGA